MSGAPPAWMDEVPPTDPSAHGGGTAVRERPARNAVQQIVAPDTAIVALSDDPAARQAMEALRNSLYPGASYESIAMVLSYCRMTNVDPFLKTVHIVPMWDNKTRTMRDVLMPGIADYRIKASRSGTYLGKSEPEFGPMADYELSGVKVTMPEWCKVTVKRLVAGHIAPFTAIEYWIENYATAKRDTQAPNSMWQRRGRGQLAKCAEAQALRMAFPEFNGGVPTAEEMEGKSFDLTTIDMPSVSSHSTREDNVKALERQLAASGAETTTDEKVPATTVSEGSHSAPQDRAGIQEGGGGRAAPSDQSKQEQPKTAGPTQTGRPGTEQQGQQPVDDRQFIDKVTEALLIDNGIGNRWLQRLISAIDKCPTMDDLAAIKAIGSVKGAIKDGPPAVRSQIMTLFAQKAQRMAEVDPSGQEAA